MKLTAEQLAQETAEELRHCIDSFEDGWGFNIAMAQDALVRAFNRYGADLSKRLADTKGHLRWALENGAFIGGGRCGDQPTCQECFSQTDGDEESIPHKPDCPYAAAAKMSRNAEPTYEELRQRLGNLEAINAHNVQTAKENLERLAASEAALKAADNHWVDCCKMLERELAELRQQSQAEREALVQTIDEIFRQHYGPHKHCVEPGDFDRSCLSMAHTAARAALTGKRFRESNGGPARSETPAGKKAER